MFLCKLCQERGDKSRRAFIVAFLDLRVYETRFTAIRSYLAFQAPNLNHQEYVRFRFVQIDKEIDISSLFDALVFGA